MQQIHYFRAVRGAQFYLRSPPLRRLATFAKQRHQRAGAGAGRSPLFDREPSIALTGLGRMLRPYLDEIARNASHAREVARTLTPRPSAHPSARQAVDSLQHPSN
jgi:hypothetical protein